MADLTEHEAQERSFAVSAVKFNPAEKGQFAVIPEGYELKSLEEFQEVANRIRTDHRFVDVRSLATYLNRFASDDTMISADYEEAVIRAVIDGDHLDGAYQEIGAHKDHKASFAACFSDSLKAWLDFSGKRVSQVDFGLFLEDRAVDVVSPDAASVMEMVMTFDAIKKVSFRSSQRLHDGQRQFQYVEENEARGAVTLPDHFIIMAPVYRGLDPQRIKFMIRYRIADDGKLSFQIDMHDRTSVLRDAFDRCVDALRADMTLGLPIYIEG